MIKMIVMDMDGTLLTHENKILPETCRVLQQVQKMGVRLVLASGRSYSKLLPYARELEMDRYGGYLVEINGTAVYDLKDDKREVLAQMQVADIRTIYRYFMQWKVEIIAHLDEGMYDYIPEDMKAEKQQYRLEHQLAKDYPWTAGAFSFMADNRKGYPQIHYIQDPDEIQETVNKISVTYHPDEIAKIVKKAKQDLQDHYWLGLTSPRWLEIMIPGVTKATGLQHVAEISGISLAEMMVFGDGENDIEMLQEAGIGIAMGNAFVSVKEIADQITAGNEENGIALAIQKYFHL